MRQPRNRERRRINLALQGGGAHGAFTWGVLDRLLEEDWLDFDTVSATSAGAFNAVAMLSGLATGGREGARSTLREIWQALQRASVPEVLRFNPFIAGMVRMEGLGAAVAPLGALVSPYSFNPFDLNPLRGLLERHVDFAAIRERSAVGILVAATEVASGRARLFRRPEIDVEVVLASACLPSLHRAVEIGGDHYWDGGFSANPDLLMLARLSRAGDTLIVLVNPTRRAELPTRSQEIAGQLSLITFNQPFLRDVGEIANLKEALRGSAYWLASPSARRLARHRHHLIEAGAHTGVLSQMSKLSPGTELLPHLFEKGREEATAWLETRASDIGRRGVDLAGQFLRVAHAPSQESLNKSLL